MTLLTEKGTFTKTTSTSTPVSQQVTLSDSSLTPKIIILWTSGQTTSNGTYTDHTLWSYGWSDTANDVCQSMRTHETNENEVYVMRNDAIISIMSLTAGSEVSRADVSSVAAGSFTLNWSTQSDTSAMVIHYIVIGGTDITNVSAFTGTHLNFSTGNHTYNGTGTTFTPDFALMMNSNDAANTVNTVTAGTDKSIFSLGAIKSTTEQWLLTAKEETATTSNGMMYLNSGRCMGCINATGSTISYEGTFVSFNNAAGGGITINVTNAASNSAVLGFLLIKGGNWDCDVFQQRDGTGTQDVTFTDNTVVPKLVTVTGINSATLGTPVSNHYVSVGASDGTNEGNCYNGSTDALATWVTARSTDTGKLYRQATPAATATSSTLNAECDMSDMDTAGQFTLDWTTADSTLRRMAYWMVGEVGGTTPVSETSIHKYDLLANVAQTNIHKYDMIGNALRANIHKYDILNTVPPQTSIHKYDLRQNIAQTNIHKYNLLKNILQTSIHKYNLIQNILQTSIHKYHILNTIAQTSIHKYNLLQNILRTSIHKYNMDGLVAALSIHKYNLLQYVTQNNIHKYHLLTYIAQTSIQKYHILINILQSSIHKYSLLAYIAQTSIHKYNLLKYVTQNNIHKYNFLAYIAQTSIHKYNLLQYILQSSIHKYDLEVLGAVVAALIAKYDIRQYITQTNIQKYNLLKNIAQTSIHKYNLLVNIAQSSIHKYSLLQNVVQASIQKYDILQYILQSSIHKYDILIEALTVLTNSIHKYHILNTIAQTSKHKYDILNTVARTSIHKYSLLQQILRTSIHKYNMGGVISAQSRHLYNIFKDVFSSSVAGGKAHRALKTIKYPVYAVQELEKIERRKRLRRTEAVIIPAFKWNIHKTVAPFVVTNPIRNRVTVRFAVVKPEPLFLIAKRPLPIQIEGKIIKKEAQKAKSAHVMQQKTIEKYGKRLNKLAKLMKLFLLAEEYDKLSK